MQFIDIHQIELYFVGMLADFLLQSSPANLEQEASPCEALQPADNSEDEDERDRAGSQAVLFVVVECMILCVMYYN